MHSEGAATAAAHNGLSRLQCPHCLIVWGAEWGARVGELLPPNTLVFPQGVAG